MPLAYEARLDRQQFHCRSGNRGGRATHHRPTCIPARMACDQGLLRLPCLTHELQSMFVPLLRHEIVVTIASTTQPATLPENPTDKGTNIETGERLATRSKRAFIHGRSTALPSNSQGRSRMREFRKADLCGGPVMGASVAIGDSRRWWMSRTVSPK